MSYSIKEKGQVFPIACVGKDQRAAIFHVHSEGEVPEEGGGVIEFRVRKSEKRPDSGNDDGHFFLLQLTPEHSSAWRIKNIGNQGFTEFQATGVAHALLVALADRYEIEIWSQKSGRKKESAPSGRTLQGSRHRIESGGENERNELATKMWAKIQARLDKHQVIYDEFEDLFKLGKRDKSH